MPVEHGQPGRAGLSLYANLLRSDGDKSLGTISSAPVLYDQPQAPEVQSDPFSTEKSQLSSGRYESASYRGKTMFRD